MKSIKIIICVKGLDTDNVPRLNGFDKHNQYLEYRELSQENVQGIMGDTVVVFIPEKYQCEYEWLLEHYDVVFYNWSFK